MGVDVGLLFNHVPQACDLGAGDRQLLTLISSQVTKCYISFERRWLYRVVGELFWALDFSI